MKTFVLSFLSLCPLTTLASTRNNPNDTLVKKYLQGDQDAKKELLGSRETFRAKRGNLMERISRKRNAEKWLIKLFKDVGKGRKRDSLDKSNMKSYLGTIKVDEMRTLAQIRKGCLIMGQYLEFFDKKVLAASQNARCLAMMIKGAKSVDPKGEFVSNLPGEWANKSVVSRIGSKLAKATPAFLKSLNETVELARYVDPKSLNNMSKEQLSQFTAGFIARIPKFLLEEVAKAIPNMTDDAFSMYTGHVEPKNAKVMRRAQITKFNVQGDVDAEKRCARLPIHELNDDQFTGVDTMCLLSFLRGPSSRNRDKEPLLGRRWALVKPGWLDGVKDEEILKALRNIDDRDKKYISSATWNQMLKQPGVCANIVGEGNFNADQIIDADGECFSRLRDTNLMIRILLHNPDVREDILAYATKKTMNKLNVVIAGKEVHGFQVISHMKASSQRKGEILAKLGTKAEGQSHACEAIDDIDTIHNIREFSQAPLECFEALKVDIRKEDYDKSPCLMNVMSAAELMATFKDRWAKISEGSLALLLRRGLLDEINKDIFMVLNQSALTAFKPEHVIAISYLKEVPTDRLHRLADDAYALMEEDQFVSNIGWDKVSDKQLGQVSIKVAAPKKRATAKLTAQQVKDFDMRFSRFSALQLEAVPENAWTVVTDKVFMAIVPEALTRVTASQMSKLEEKVLLSLTAKQAELIGRDVTDANTNPLNVFKPIVAKLNKDTKAVIEQRLAQKAQAKENDATMLKNTGLLAIAILASLSILV